MRILEERELRDRETRIILGNVIRKSGRLDYMSHEKKKWKKKFLEVRFEIIMKKTEGQGN